MKQRVCPHCGFKNFTENPRCSKCNELLDNLPTRKSSPPPPITPPATSATTAHSRASPDPLVPAPVPPSTTSPVSPASPPVPYRSASYPAYPPNPLPSHLARLSPPILQGEVISTGEVQVEDKRVHGGDIFRTLAGLVILPFRPIMGLMTLASGGNRPKEHKNVHVLRVQRADGTAVMARIENDMVGATIDMGDYVSIWGDTSGGVVIVKLAFNHTVNGEVRLRH